MPCRVGSCWWYSWCYKELVIWSDCWRCAPKVGDTSITKICILDILKYHQFSYHITNWRIPAVWPVSFNSGRGKYCAFSKIFTSKQKWAKSRSRDQVLRSKKNLETVLWRNIELAGLFLLWSYHFDHFGYV